MRVAIFTNNYLPNPYGVATSIETFRRELEKMGPASTRGDASSTRGGHQVFIFAPHFPGYIDRDKNVFRYPAIDIEVKFKFPLAIPYSWKMHRILKKMDLDIIHAQHPNLLGTAALSWARRKKIPLVFTWHTLYDHYTNFVSFLPASWAAKYIIRKAVKFANQADAVIVPTDSIIPQLRAWGVTQKNIFPVATGVVEKDFVGADRSIIRKKYNITDDEAVLLSTHRLTGEKNMEFLFRALAPVLKNNRVKFLVAGDGYLAPKLKKFCSDNGLADKVFFCGVVSRAEIKNYYAAADIFVHTSTSETQGMVMTESMYMGLPIVAVKATGASSLVLNNGSGFLVEGNEKEFADAVLKLVNDFELRKKFGETSAKIARLQFTAEICTRKMVRVYEGCLNRLNH
ncbi:MAG: glycosyltransferase [Parcubacteria group bacterium]